MPRAMQASSMAVSFSSGTRFSQFHNKIVDFTVAQPARPPGAFFGEVRAGSPQNMRSGK
jgi:hypothetical protein